jgi:tetratricopeptide (TPR) repeat protein
MSPLLLAIAFVTLLAPQKNDIQINVDTPSGATVSGQCTFRVTVASTNPINQVEFYVGSDLRDTETSTPYLFPLDTINENDGDIKVRFKAYTSENQTSDKVLVLHVDNKKSAGAAFHVMAGQEDLSNSDWQDAITEGRIVMKLDAQNNDGRLILARAYLGLNTFDKAQQYVGDAVTQDPKNDKALQLQAVVDLRLAFNTFAKQGADQADVFSSISDALKAAVEARRKSLDLEADSFGEPTSANLIPYVDALLREERFSAAIAALKKTYDHDPKDLSIANRIAYAQLRSGHYPEAVGTLQETKGMGPLNAYSDAVLALAYVQMNRPDDADKAIQDGVQDDPDNVGLRTAQAFIALKRNKRNTLSNVASDLGRDEGQRATVNYFLMALADQQQRFNDARRYFETAALAEPDYPDTYIEQANYSISLAQTKGMSAQERDEDYKEANLYYQVALIARPEAVDALAGLATVALLQKNMADAIKYGQAAVAASPNTAAGHYALAAIDEIAGNIGDAQAEMKRAVALDPPNLDGVELPKAVDVWHYLNTGGRIPVIVAP